MGEKKEKENTAVTVVLKADFHCDGCASKIIKCIRSFHGVDAVTIDGQKITVVGKVDPAKLREKIEQKTHKKVEVVSPQIKKDGGKKDKADGKENNGGDEKENKNESKDKNSDDKSEQKSLRKGATGDDGGIEAELALRRLHPENIQNHHQNQGYKDMKIDAQKDLVTVTGAMDMKALAEVLKKQLKKEVAIVPGKKDGEKKEKGGGGGDGGETGDEKAEGKKKQAPVGYLYPFMYEPIAVNAGENIHYNPYAVQYHAPQIFSEDSDENPNACSVM